MRTRLVFVSVICLVAAAVFAALVVRPRSVRPDAVHPTQDTERPAAQVGARPEQAGAANAAVRRFCDPRLDDRERLPADLFARLPVLVQPADVAAVRAVMLNSGESTAIRNAAMEALRRTGMPDLVQEFAGIATSDGDPTIRAFATQHLAMLLIEPRSPEVVSEVVTRLRRLGAGADSGPRREATLALTTHHDAATIAALGPALDSPLWQRDRDVIVRCFGIAELKQFLPDVRALARARDEVLRRSALDVLAGWKDDASADIFREALSSEVLKVRQAGAYGMKAIGRTEGSEYLRPVASFARLADQN